MHWCLTQSLASLLFAGRGSWTMLHYLLQQVQSSQSKVATKSYSESTGTQSNFECSIKIVKVNMIVKGLYLTDIGYRTSWPPSVKRLVQQGLFCYATFCKKAKKTNY